MKPLMACVAFVYLYTGIATAEPPAAAVRQLKTIETRMAKTIRAMKPPAAKSPNTPPPNQHWPEDLLSDYLLYEDTLRDADLDGRRLEKARKNQETWGALVRENAESYWSANSGRDNLGRFTGNAGAQMVLGRYSQDAYHLLDSTPPAGTPIAFEARIDQQTEHDGKPAALVTFRLPIVILMSGSEKWTAGEKVIIIGRTVGRDDQGRFIVNGYPGSGPVTTAVARAPGTTCKSCSGRGSHTCPACGGKGFTVKSRSHDGGGYFRNRTAEQVPCTKCKGGRIECKACGGKGR